LTKVMPVRATVVVPLRGLPGRGVSGDDDGTV